MGATPVLEAIRQGLLQAEVDLAAIVVAVEAIRGPPAAGDGEDTPAADDDMDSLSACVATMGVLPGIGTSSCTGGGGGGGGGGGSGDASM